MSNKYKKIIALVLVVVMLGSGFAVLSSMASPQSSVNNPYITAPSSPSSVINTSTNISENISYYQNANIGDSPTYNASLPVSENTTYSNYNFSESSEWGISGNGYVSYYNGTTVFSVNNPDNAINNKIATTNGTINAITTAVWIIDRKYSSSIIIINILCKV